MKTYMLVSSLRNHHQSKWYLQRHATRMFSSVTPQKPEEKKSENVTEKKQVVAENNENQLLNQAKTLAPGLLAAGAVMNAGYFTAQHLGQLLLAAQGVTESAPSPISGIPIAILLGLGINNMVNLPEQLKPGIQFATKPLLQAGIICVGANLSAMDLVQTGLAGIPAVIASITVGMTFVPWFARKMGLPYKMGALIAAGTSICGVTAITALSPAIKANKQESSFAIANVVAFGTLGMLTYPYLAHSLLETSHQIGMFLGLSVHDTSQVIGSALTYSTVYSDEEVLRVAAVTKLTRNICLAGVIPGLTWATMRHEKQLEQQKQGVVDAVEQKFEFPSAEELKKYVPGFIFGFIGMSAFRSCGDFSLAQTGSAYGMFDAATWSDMTKFTGKTLGSHYLLGTAMAAVGLSTSVSALRGVGYKPFVVGMVGAGAVGLTGFTSTVLLCNALGM